jgi:hypothetical protein
VDVHRLLAENSVDERLTEMLALKRGAFDDYARKSDLAGATPDAVDVSDLKAKAATEAEKQRRIIEIERKRLRLEGTGLAG